MTEDVRRDCPICRIGLYTWPVKDPNQNDSMLGWCTECGKVMPV